MASELLLEIVTPFGKTLNTEIYSCTIPGADGQFQVLKNHAALIAKVDVGAIKIEYLDKRVEFLATGGGFCEVKDDIIKIMVESAEFAKQIDTGRAEAAKKRAEERLHSHQADIDLERSKLALLRAINRLKVAGIK